MTTTAPAQKNPEGSNGDDEADDSQSDHTKDDHEGGEGAAVVATANLVAVGEAAFALS